MLGLGAACAVLAWIPYVGSIAGGILVVLVAATDFPGQPLMAYAAAALFVLVRLLDDFVFMPATIGNSLKMHPSVTVLMIFDLINICVQTDGLTVLNAKAKNAATPRKANATR